MTPAGIVPRRSTDRALLVTVTAILSDDPTWTAPQGRPAGALTWDVPATRRDAHRSLWG